MAERWQVIFLCNELIYFLDAKVTCWWVVMMLADEFCLHDFQDVKKALVMQHVIDVLLIILDQLFGFKFPRLFVFGLQFLESQSHAADAGLIRAFEG